MQVLAVSIMRGLAVSTAETNKPFGTFKHWNCLNRFIEGYCREFPARMYVRGASSL
jgi:hypothetical protein|tara:strand:+ start:140 stop:307 length:168 start_codon:yes stop_codon:yes gene_type:complete